MSRTEALLRIADCLNEIDTLDKEFSLVKADFKRRREILESDLNMCREDVNQMRLDEVAE